MRKISAGIIGTGFSAERHAAGYRALPYVEIGAVAGLEARRKETEDFARRLGAKRVFANYENLLRQDDIEIISICVPNYLHQPVAVAAAEHGKHVVIEKPLARSVEEGKSIVDAARIGGVRLMYAENFQYAPSFAEAMETVNQGGIGEIFMAAAREAHSGPHSQWFYDFNLAGGGALIDLGIHDVHLLRMFTKSEVREVYAITMKTRRDLSVEDNAIATMKFRSGALGTLEESWTTEGAYDIRVEVYGEEGNLVINPTRMAPPQASSGTGSGNAGMKVESTSGRIYPIPEEFYTFGYIQEIEHFVRCVVEDRKPNTSGEDGLTTLKVVMAMYESAKTNRPATVEAP